jgi:hypothetical protein
MSKRFFGNQRGEVIPGATLRTDAWWLEPLSVIALLGAFAVYATWAGLQNAHYYVAPYLSPAFLILWIPGGFRVTCYYYRKAYYRSFFGSPPGCAVRDISKSYSGETRFPFILQNIHRYFFWLGIPVIAFLWWDAVMAFNFSGGFGMGVGTLVLILNAALLSLYTFSCHSCRHLCGGGLNVFSKAPARHGIWRVVTRLNERHMLIAWVSLIWVGLTDVYIRLLSTGIIKDVRFF